MFFLVPVCSMAQTPLLDEVKAENLKTVLLYPYSGSFTAAARTLTPPIKSLYDTNPFILEFDDLATEYSQFHVKIIHCKSDWTPSDVSDLDYLSDFNDFIINDYEVSQNTKFSYYHYRFQVPAVRISGNYVIQVFADYRLEEPVITRRMMVYEPLVQPSGSVRIPQDASLWRTHQQLDFQLDYRNYSVRSARQEFKVMVRKNYDWNTLKPDWKATSDNASSGTLYFRYFANENVMQAGNEFRFFDSRSTYTTGIGVEQVRQGNTDEMWLKVQGERGRLTFGEQRDYNGQFVIENREKQNPSISNDYVWINFAFRPTDEQQTDDLYVVGGFNFWQTNEASKLEYDTQSGLFTQRMLLKQGVYDYAFLTKNVMQLLDYTKTEGNFSETENVYEIFVYHQPPASRTERLIGYALINSRIRD